VEILKQCKKKENGGKRHITNKMAAINTNMLEIEWM
jgi:hypothetical protein